MKKVYISVPMFGINRSVIKRQIEIAKSIIKDMYNPESLTFDPITINGNNKYEEECLGKDIEVLLQCDAVFFCRGWQTHKGCLLEFAAAQLYHKKIIFE